jgi:hypothetical protein
MAAPSPALVRIRTLWSALTIGCLMYVVVARWMRPAAAPGGSILPDPNDPVELGAALAAIAAVTAGVMVSRLIARSTRAGFGSIPRSEEQVMNAAVLPLLVRYASFESAAVLGLVLVARGGPAAKVLPFVGLALAALVAGFPTRGRVLALLSD